MERFFGFDLGDAESAVSVLKKKDTGAPEVLTLCDTKSLVTAYARTADRGMVIGESACWDPDAVERKLRFKSRFLVDAESAKDITAFASGVLGELYSSGGLVQNEDCTFHIGCPAGWDRNAREKYRKIFEKVGYPPMKIISESRAALVSACQSKNLQVGYDILSHPVLVVDIGSSTTDFAYIMGGREVELRTAGEVFLGGGIMDEILLETAVERSKDRAEIREIFEKSSPWRSYCEFAARRLKEKYFADEDYWKKNDCMQTVRIRYGRPVTLTLRMDADTAEALTDRATEKLGGRSFHQVFTESLRETRRKITGDVPELLFLTGGVSKLPAIADWCREIYPEAVVITGMEPEFSVSRGLAWCGRIDDELRDFMKEVENLRDSSIVEQLVGSKIDRLYKDVVEAVTEPILKEAVLPVIDRWRDGSIERLQDIDGEMEKEITAYLHTDEARKCMIRPVTEWLKPIAYSLEEHTVPICVKHNIPYRALSLTSFLNVSPEDFRIDAKDVFAVEETTWMIDTIISIMIGLLCGGGGIAVIANGLPGLIAGAVLSLIILFLGKEKMQGAILGANIPVPMRKLLPKRYFESRLTKISAEVRSDFMKRLEKDKNEEITERMVHDISDQIEACLMKMAEVVEIPLG